MNSKNKNCWLWGVSVLALVFGACPAVAALYQISTEKSYSHYVEYTQNGPVDNFYQIQVPSGKKAYVKLTNTDFKSQNDDYTTRTFSRIENGTKRDMTSWAGKTGNVSNMVFSSDVTLQFTTFVKPGYYLKPQELANGQIVYKPVYYTSYYTRQYYTIAVSYSSSGSGNDDSNYDVVFPYTGGEQTMFTTNISSFEGRLIEQLAGESNGDNWLGTREIVDATSSKLTCKITAQPNPSTGKRTGRVTYSLKNEGKRVVTVLQKPAPSASATQTVTFNAAGGSCSTSQKTYPVGGYYTNLPTATRTDHTFDGWYTATNGGTKITSGTAVTTNAERTLFAQWTANPSAPGAPTGLSATTTLTNGIQVSWTGGSGATSHNVWRGTTTTQGDARRIKIGATSPYPDNDSELVAGKSYYYWIEATNSAGNAFSKSSAKGQKAVSLSLGRSVVSATADGGNQSFSVTANTSWSASSGASWISFTTGAGDGNGTCAFTVAANPDANARTGTVTVVAGKNTDAPKTATVSVVQQAGTRFAVGSYELDMEDGLVWLRFPGAKGTTFRVERTKELGGTWATALTFTATNDGMNEVSASIPGKWDTGFFRLGKDGGDAPVGPGTSTNVPTGLYLVVDLSGGPDAASWPVSELEAVPSGGWTDEYKTTKLVLRRIEPGTFTMGSTTNELGGGSSGETPHEVTISQPFFMGVFEVTQKQWVLAMGNNPSAWSGNARPVERVSYDMIRGTGQGTNWPSDGKVDAGSFMGVLRAKTGMTFDLPTEAQWEYACRAGTTTALNSGKDLTGIYRCSNMNEVGRYFHNTEDGKGGYKGWHTTVGSYLPNAWGLYDMHGNVEEWCRDWYASNLGMTAVTNPKGASSGSDRVQRGGGWRTAWVQSCRSASRHYGDPSDANDYLGFRIAMILSE